MSNPDELRLPLPCNTHYSEIFKRFPLWRPGEKPPEDRLAMVVNFFQPPTSRDGWPKTLGDIGNDRIKNCLEANDPDAVGSIKRLKYSR